MSFKILIDNRLKVRSIRESFGFIRKLFKQVQSIPTNYGCMEVDYFYYDQEKLLEYAGKMAKTQEKKSKIKELKSQLEEGGHVDEIDKELDGDVVEAVVSHNPDFDFDVSLTFQIPFKGLKNLRSLDDFLTKRDEDSIIEDTEVSEDKNPPWEEPQYVEDYFEDKTGEEGVESSQESTEELETRTIDTLSDLAYDGEPRGSFYILRLMVVVNASVTFKELEEDLEKILAPIRKNASNIATFPSYSGGFTYI